MHFPLRSHSCTLSQRCVWIAGTGRGGLSRGRPYQKPVPSILISKSSMWSSQVSNYKRLQDLGALILAPYLSNDNSLFFYSPGITSFRKVGKSIQCLECSHIYVLYIWPTCIRTTESTGERSTLTGIYIQPSVDTQIRVLPHKHARTLRDWSACPVGTDNSYSLHPRLTMILTYIFGRIENDTLHFIFRVAFLQNTNTPLVVINTIKSW